MKNKYLISVILPIYDKNEYLEESIKSILSQSYKNIELIIIIEKTKEQKEIYLKIKEKFKDKRLRLIKNIIKLGLSKSLNKGIKKSKGKYIARMDSDDISLKDRLKVESNFLEKNLDVDIVASNSEIIGNNNGPWFCGELSFDRLKVNLLLNNPICHPTVMFRKESLIKYKLKYNNKFISEDYELWCSAILKGCVINVLSDTLLKYRVSNNNITSQDRKTNNRIDSINRTLFNYYKKALSLELTEEEIMNMQICFEYPKNEKTREDLIIKIVNQNRINNFFNEEELTWILGYYSICDKRNWKNV